MTDEPIEYFPRETSLGADQRTLSMLPTGTELTRPDAGGVDDDGQLVDVGVVEALTDEAIADEVRAILREQEEQREKAAATPAPIVRYGQDFTTAVAAVGRPLDPAKEAAYGQRVTQAQLPEADREWLFSTYVRFEGTHPSNHERRLWIGKMADTFGGRYTPEQLAALRAFAEQHLIDKEG